MHTIARRSGAIDSEFVSALRDDGLGTTYLSGGLGIKTMRYGIDIAGRTAVDGPSDHMIIAIGCLVATALSIIVSVLTLLPIFR